MVQLKTFFNNKLIKTISTDIKKVFTNFDTKGFENSCTKELENLELKERSILVAKNLKEYLPNDYKKSISIILNSMPEKVEDVEIESMKSFYFAPHAMFIEKFGLDHLEESLEGMLKITKVFTSEFTIRPFIEKYPKKMLKILEEWAKDENENVRRLVSEGTRPRLPWAPKLSNFIEDPKPVIELLELLKEDSSLYVRRSVANNLNDIAKDSPELVIKTLQKWKNIENEGTQWLIKHASRTLVKNGNQDVLKLLGFGKCDNILISNFSISPKNIKIGEELKFEFDIELKDEEEEDVDVMIDYAVHYVKSNGKLNPKVFKLTKKVISKGNSIKIKKKQSFKKITTRKYYKGKHFIEIIVNGEKMNKIEFNLD